MMMENEKYSMLVVGLYCDSRHIQRFCDNLKLINPLVDITILTDVPEEQQKIYDDASLIIRKLAHFAEYALLGCLLADG